MCSEYAFDFYQDFKTCSSRAEACLHIKCMDNRLGIFVLKILKLRHVSGNFKIPLFVYIKVGQSKIPTVDNDYRPF